MSRRTTDTAYDDLAEWVIFTQNTLYAVHHSLRGVFVRAVRAR